MLPVLKVLGGLLALAVALGGVAVALNRPPLFAAPGPLARLVHYLTTNVAATAPDALFPELRTRRYDLAPQDMREVVHRAIAACGWEGGPDSGTEVIRAVVVTPLWRFVDDVEVTVVADAHGTVVNVRASSRIGRGDFAANTRHVIDLYDAIARQLRSGAE